MTVPSRVFLRVGCAGRSGEGVLRALEAALARAASRRVRPVIVLSQLARLRGSLVNLFKGLTDLVMRTEPRPVIVDPSRYAAAFLEHYPGAVPIVVCEEEPRAEDPCRVLVVDDHEDNQEFLCHLVRSAGHHCEGVSTVAGAVQRLDAGAHDLVFLDLKLPDGDGLEVARHLRSRGRSVPVVAVSCYLGLLEGGVSERYGIHRSIAKPYQVGEVLRVLQEFGPRG